jgi:hypothetical protein
VKSLAPYRERSGRKSPSQKESRSETGCSDHRQPFASTRFIAETATFPLRFRATRVMDRHAPIKRRKDSPETTMKNAEANTTEHAATVAVQGATVAPEKASAKKGATQKKGAPKGQKAAKVAKTKAEPKKDAKAGKKAPKPAPAKEASTARPESKGAKILALIGRPKGATLAEVMAYASHCTSLAL